ncbi:MAG: 2-oxo acid dehydrogenase subunit E2 [Chloroflexi bacterium]|nr:2-oxo acid dehydrogenase subunit E2 [Chloroflexota bacterium]
MATKIIMPKLGFDMATGKIVRWLKREGDPVRKGEPLLEIETDKATVELEATADGVLEKILVGESVEVPVGDPVGEIVSPTERNTGTGQPAGKTPLSAATGMMAAPVAVASPPVTAPAAQSRLSSRLDASPLAKRMAAELGIDLQRVEGSGPGGRITKEDIETYQVTMKVVPALPMATEEPKVAGASAEGKPLSRMRQTIARRMAESKGPVPQFYLTTDVDMAPGMVVVNQLNEAGKGEDLRVSPLSLVMRASALALRKYPNLNASFGGDRLIMHDDVNVGVAVAVEGGLLTPVIAHCDQKSVAEIARQTRAAAERARSGKLSRDDLTQGTFSVSNLGAYDIDHFVAIVNPPEAAIMAIGTAREVPIVDGGQVRVSLRMKLTLSADHRVTDGAEAARFLQEVKRLLQSPLSLFL